MDTRLEMEREPAQQSSSSAGIGSGKLPDAHTSPKASAMRLGKALRADGANEQQSLDPMRATDRYRLVMPYSLRL